MSKSGAFIARLNRYGTTVSVEMMPTSTTQCSCVEYGWPNPDCTICDGKGWSEDVDVVSVKAFIFPLRDSDKWLDYINIGVAIGGQIMAYFSPLFDLPSAQHVIWDDIRYKVTGVDRAIIADEMIYRSCHLDKVD